MKSSVFSEFDLYFYPEVVIKKAIEYYLPVCTIDLKINNKIATCYFDIEEMYAEQVKGEFGNFLIELLQQRKDKAC